MAYPRERWLVAAWPGLGHVGTTAAVYLLSKLTMHQIAEFPGRDFFEPERVEVKRGVLKAARLPRSRLFLWRNPGKGPDVLVFLGEAQPPTGRMALCRRLLSVARQLHARRVFTFAAMTADSELTAPPRAFGAATDADALDELKRHEVPVVEEAELAGLNGLLLAAADEAGLPGTALLGETPSLAAQLPYAGAAAAVLRAFMRIAGIDMDLADLESYGRAVQAQVSELYDQVREALRDDAEREAAAKPPEPPEKDPAAERIESLFAAAKRDRRKAFELKTELDKLGRFRQYEDRFLDLFEGEH